MAQNTTVDYLACAIELERSIKHVMPDSNVTIITDLPHGDQVPNSDWKLHNDWQVYDASPYEYTIKLEADMFVPENIDYWWDILRGYDLVVSTHVRDYKGNISNVRSYRQFIDDNQLPDTYNAITYFKKSEKAKYFYQIVRDVFENWDSYKAILKCNVDELATTDWAYSIAVHIIGVEECTLPVFDSFSMVHMKKDINDLRVDNWTDQLIYECGEVFKVNTFPQRYPFHYHIKEFSTVLRNNYG
jgi:hypothetical protein